MKEKPFFLIVLGALLIFPFWAFAQPGSLAIPLTVVAANLANITLNILWSVAVAFTIIMFIVAAFKFLTAQGDQSKIAEARRAVLWGFAGAVTIILAWSVITVLRTQIGV